MDLNSERKRGLKSTIPEVRADHRAKHGDHEKVDMLVSDLYTLVQESADQGHAGGKVLPSLILTKQWKDIKFQLQIEKSHVGGSSIEDYINIMDQLTNGSD